MRGIISIAIASSALLVGCAVRGPIDAELRCRDRTVTATHMPGSLTVHPEYIEVCHGYNIRIRLRPGIDVGRGRTIPEDSDQEWLGRPNGTRNEILISVPDESASEGPFKYSLEIDGVGRVDPYVRIIF